MGALNIEKNREEAKVVYNLSGRLDTQSSPDFQDDLDATFEESEKDYNNHIELILDFDNLEYMSSAGLRTVLYAKKQVDSMDSSSMKVINVVPEVMEVFSMTGFTDFLTIEEKQVQCMNLIALALFR